VQVRHVNHRTAVSVSWSPHEDLALVTDTIGWYATRLIEAGGAGSNVGAAGDDNGSNIGAKSITSKDQQERTAAALAVANKKRGLIRIFNRVTTSSTGATSAATAVMNAPTLSSSFGLETFNADAISTLASNYKIKGMSFTKLCRHNSSVAESVGRIDLAHTWQILHLLFQVFLSPFLSLSVSLSFVFSYFSICESVSMEQIHV
jgi:hypothetical protein